MSKKVRLVKPNSNAVKALSMEDERLVISQKDSTRKAFYLPVKSKTIVDVSDIIFCWALFGGAPISI